MENIPSYADSCTRCSKPYEKATGRHIHNDSNLCDDLLIKYEPAKIFEAYGKKTVIEIGAITRRVQILLKK